MDNGKLIVDNGAGDERQRSVFFRGGGEVAGEYENRVREALQRAVSRALERKRRLGQYAVFWRDGRPVCVGPDALPVQVGSHDDLQVNPNGDAPSTIDK